MNNRWNFEIIFLNDLNRANERCCIFAYKLIEESIHMGKDLLLYRRITWKESGDCEKYLLTNPSWNYIELSLEQSEIFDLSLMFFKHRSSWVELAILALILPIWIGSFFRWAAKERYVEWSLVYCSILPLYFLSSDWYTGSIPGFHGQSGSRPGTIPCPGGS